MDNGSIARMLGEIADLLEIKGENSFKIRAYRNGADIVGQAAETVAQMTEADLRGWPGIGKDLAARIVEIAATGDCAVRKGLLEEFPETLLDVLRLQGVGPKTVARLYHDLHVKSLTDLEQAARAGRIRGLKGMGAKKEALMLKAIEERQRHAGRHLLADTAELAARIVAHLVAQRPALEYVPVGSVRRGAETCGDIDIVAVGTDPTVMDVVTAMPDVERVLGRGDTKCSVLLRGGFQADLRLVTRAQAGAALQYFTGSKAHNVALRDRALERGLRLNEYGLFTAETMTRVAGDTEASIYEALGLAYVEPELRENRGEIEAAIARRLPTLIAEGDLRGDVHMHTTETDGRDTLEAMVEAARARGLEYVAITDHSQALAMANGLTEERALAHADRVRAMGRKKQLAVLAGIECDIRSDGRMDLTDDCLAALDIVIASVHSSLAQDETAMTARIVKAIEHPWVDIIGHPTNRLLLQREASRMHIERIVDAAKANGVALEINCQVDRLDLSDSHARLARDRGVPLVISSDAHATSALALTRWGIRVARRAWLSPADVLNTRPVADFRAALKRGRRAAI